jgi:hypothetical protein
MHISYVSLCNFLQVAEQQEDMKLLSRNLFLNVLGRAPTYLASVNSRSQTPVPKKKKICHLKFYVIDMT